MPAEASELARGMSRALAAAFAFAGLVACHRAPSATAPSEGTVVRADAGGGAGATSIVGPARCRPSGTTDGAPVVDDANAVELEVGDVVPTTDGYAAGVVHRTSAGRVAAVLRVGSGAPPAGQRGRWLDLAPTLGDAPPAKVVAHAGAGGADLVAAEYLLGPAGGHEGGRNLALYALSPSLAVAPPPMLVVSQQHDDSLAFDLAYAGASGVLVWDEGAAPSRGVIRAVALDATDAGASVHDVSPPESDAEVPRLMADGAGFVAIWIARKPEAPRALDASEPEATGEPRSYGWLESVRLDARGLAAGPVRALTPPSGHVSAYDVIPLGALDRGLLVVARDDGESVDGSGGALVRVRVIGGAPEPPAEFQSDGLGRGAPVLVDGTELFLAWVGAGEQGRLLALDQNGAPMGPPSAEDLLNDARPLRTLPGIPGPTRLLVAASSGPSTILRAIVCAR